MLLTWLFILLQLPALALAQAPPVPPAPLDFQKPQLRVESGMHTDTVYDLEVDRQGRFIVTAGADKTI